jgi:hypothetical protein
LKATITALGFLIASLENIEIYQEKAYCFVKRSGIICETSYTRTTPVEVYKYLVRILIKDHLEKIEITTPSVFTLISSNTIVTPPGLRPYNKRYISLYNMVD